MLTEYEASQQQRYIERQQRRWKREYTAMRSAGLDTGEASSKLAQWRNAEKDFLRQTGLKLDSARSQVANFGREAARRATAEAKMLQKAAESSILKRETDKGANRTPIVDNDYKRIQRAFERKGRIFRADDESERYCNARGAEGITLNADTVLFVKNPSRAAVFEELIHTGQFRSGKIDGTAISRVRAEIDAKERLLKHSKAYRLSDAEIDETERLLENDRKDLKLLTEVMKNEK